MTDRPWESANPIVDEYGRRRSENLLPFSIPPLPEGQAQSQLKPWERETPIVDSNGVRVRTTRSGAPRLIENIPTEQDIEYNRARSRTRLAAARRFDQRPATERYGAVGTQLMSEMPILRNMVEPNSNPAVADLREGYPIDSNITRHVGEMAPYAAVAPIGTSLPFFQQMAVQGGLGGGIGGLDAAANPNSTGGDVARGAGLGALFGAAGPVAQRLISPISPELRAARRQFRADTAMRNDFRSQLNDAQTRLQHAERELAELNNTPFHRRTPEQRARFEDLRYIRRQARDQINYIENERLPELERDAGPVARQALTNALPQPIRGTVNVLESGMNIDPSARAIIAAVGGHVLSGGHLPAGLATGATALASPYAARYAHRIATHTIPDDLANTLRYRAGNAYLENSLMHNPNARAIINFLAQGAPDSMDADQYIPQIPLLGR